MRLERMSGQGELFSTASLPSAVVSGEVEALGVQAYRLPGMGLADADTVLAAVADVTRAAPFRHMTTPGGFRMSVALSNCGRWGWTTDRSGYRYTEHDPQSGLHWPPLPPVLRNLACMAAQAAGFGDFEPDACLINRYEPGARLSLHQDRNEADFRHPIVSLSLGMSANFQFGGLRRGEPCRKLPLHHGDVLVWGGADRLRYHGVLPLRGVAHPATGLCRINLTLRRAGR